MIGMIVGGIGERIIDLFVEDEEIKRAAKAATWAAAGTVGVLDAGSSTAAALATGAAGTMMATHGAAAAIHDEYGKCVVDTVGSSIAGSMTSWVALAKASGGAAVGAAVGAGADGPDGALKGMRLGASLMQGSEAENLVKLGGGAAGAGIGALAAAEEDRGQAAEMGMSIGMALGTVRQSGLASLASEAAAPLLAAAEHEDERDRNFLDTWSDMRGVTEGLANGVVSGVGLAKGISGEAIYEVGKGLGSGGLALGILVVDRAERRRAGEDAQERGSREETAQQAQRREQASQLAMKVLGLAEDLARRRDKRA